MGGLKRKRNCSSSRTALPRSAHPCYKRGRRSLFHPEHPMSRCFISLFATLLLAASASAQPPALDPKDRLDSILMKLEERMKSVDSIYIENCERIDTDRSGTKVWKGELRFLKPNLFAIYLKQQQDPKIYELM